MTAFTQPSLSVLYWISLAYQMQINIHPFLHFGLVSDTILQHLPPLGPGSLPGGTLADAAFGQRTSRPDGVGGGRCRRWRAQEDSAVAHGLGATERFYEFGFATVAGGNGWGFAELQRVWSSRYGWFQLFPSLGVLEQEWLKHIYITCPCKHTCHSRTVLAWFMFSSGMFRFTF